MNPSLNDAFAEGFEKGMRKIASRHAGHTKSALRPPPGMLSPANRAMARAMGQKVLEEFNGTSQLGRLGARASAGDGQLRRVLDLLADQRRNPAWVHPMQLEHAYERLGRTAQTRRNTAKIVGSGLLGAGAAGGLALGAGHAAGAEHERSRVGENLQQALARMPLPHRMRLALSTLFAPDRTGDQFREAVQLG